MADDKVQVDIAVTSDTREIDDINKAIETLQKTLGMLDKEAGSSAKSVKDLGETAKKAGRDMQGVDKSVGKLEKSLGGLAKSAIKAVVAFKGFKMLGRFIKEGIGKAADYQESVHLFNVIFGKIGAEAGDAFNKEMWARLEANQGRFLKLGLDPDVMLEGQGVFASIADAAGIAAESTLDISEGLSMLASDYSAFRNIPIEDSMNKFQSGITGQIKSLRMFGIEVSMNALQAEALRYGINRTTAEMSQADKIQLRYLAIMRQGTVAMGDMAITALSPANSFRILKTQIGEAGRALGSIFIPMIKAVMPYLIAMTQAVVRLFQAIAMLFGYEKPQIGKGSEFDTPTGVSPSSVGSKAVPPVGGDIGGQNKKAKKLKKTIKEIKNVMMGFDELNVLPELPDDPNIDGLNTPGGGGGGGGGLGGLGLGDLDLSSEIAEWTKKLRDATDKALENLKLPGWDDPMFDKLKTSVERLGEALKTLGGIAGGMFKSVWENVLKPFGLWTISELSPVLIDGLSTVLEILGIVLDKAKPGMDWFFKEFLTPIASWTGEIIIQALTWVNEQLEKLRDWLEKHPGLTDFLGESLGILAGVFVTLGIAIGVFNIVAGIASVVGGILAGVIGFLLSPLGLVALAIAGVIIIGKLLVDNWDWIKEKAGIVWDWVGDKFQATMEWIGEKWDWVKEKLSDIGTWFKDIFSKAWEWIKEIWAPVGEWFSNVWEKIKEIFTPVVDFFKENFEIAWYNIKQIWNFVKGYFQGVWNDVKEVFSVVGAFFKGIFTVAWDNVKERWNNAKQYFSDVWTGIKNVFSVVGTWFKDIFTTAWTNIKQVFAPLGAFFSGLWETVKNIFLDIGTVIANGISNAFKYTINSVIGFAQRTINGFINAINMAIGLINLIPGVNLKKLVTLSIPKLAQGGMVEPGQMFIAREAGAEMVGKHGRKTAVMNNAQIVDAVASGVASAVSAVMGSGNNSGDIVIYVDGTRKVKKNISEMNRQSMINGRTVLNV